MFDWENLLLWTQCRGIGPHLAERGKSPGFSRDAEGTWLYIVELWRGCSFETGVCSVKSRHLSRYEGHLSNVN